MILKKYFRGISIIIAACAFYFIVLVGIATMYLNEATTEYTISTLYYKGGMGKEAVVHKELAESLKSKAFKILFWIPSFVRPKTNF